MFQTHTIGRISLNLNLPQEQQAYASMEAWKNTLQTQDFLARLNTLFDKYVNPNIFIVIERLEINFEKPVALEAFSQQLLIQIENKLQHLRIQLNGRYPLASLQSPLNAEKTVYAFRTFEETFSIVNHPSFSNDLNNKDFENQYTVLSTNKRLEEALLFFLERGYMPWYYSKAIHALIHQEWANIILNGSLEWIAQFKNKLSQHPIMLQRFIGQTAPQVLAEILQTWFGGLHNLNLTILINLLLGKSRQLDIPLSAHWKKAIWTALFRSLLQGKTLTLWLNNSQEIQSVFSILVQHEIQLQLHKVEIWELLFSEFIIKDENNNTELLYQFMQMQILPSESYDERVPDHVLAEEAYVNELQKKEDEPAIDDSLGGKIGNAIEKLPLFNKTEQPENDNFYFIENAGLVLLNPFLPALFQFLELTDGRQFLSLQAQEKAVTVLQFLSYGDTDTMEYELPLNKLLCGLPLDHPLDRFITLTEKETSTCQGLLQEVIQRWSVLKNSTVQEIQQGFMSRTGKLSIRPDENWLLQIERKPIDVLLDKLPFGWGYSVIQLPWMREMLFVEW